MSGDFKMSDDYVDVAERTREFRAAFPHGSLQQKSLDFIEFAGGSWVVYTAAAYRTPEDARPGMGTAWEPVPGRTPFTKGSEVQNAETAAWGRAIVAALAGDTKRIASREEVLNRRAEQAVDAELNAAKSRVKTAWEARGMTWDMAAMQADYAGWAELNDRPAIGDAAPADLNAYADHLEEPLP